LYSESRKKMYAFDGSSSMDNFNGLNTLFISGSGGSEY
jgi:hypothetical protein